MVCEWLGRLHPEDPQARLHWEPLTETTDFDEAVGSLVSGVPFVFNSPQEGGALGATST